MKWYDAFSSFYDKSLEKLYFESRARMVELLDVQPGDVVLDVACGTGANFIHFRNSGVENLKIYGTDYSDGMLKKAKALVSREKWDNMHLFQADARDLDEDYFSNRKELPNSFDCVVCVLGLSVIPDWEKVLDQLLGILKPNGKIIIVDVYAEKRDINTTIVEWVSKADLNRKIWQKLKIQTDHFYEEQLPVKERKVGGKLFAAIGRKK